MSSISAVLCVLVGASNLCGQAAFFNLPDQPKRKIARDVVAGDGFGTSVGVDGEVAVIGAPGHDAAGGDAGAAYVFRLRDGLWVEQAKLLASDAAAGAAFGTSVAVSGDRLVIGAPETGVGGTAYVFRRQGNVWIEEGRLVGGGVVAGETFGEAVAIDGGTVVVGASRAATPQGSSAGAVFVFGLGGGIWTQSL